MNKKYLLYVSMVILLQGCSTLSSDSKTIVLTPEPGQSEIVVESVASSKCIEIFGNMNCEISIDLHQAQREVSQTVITPRPTAPATQSQSTQSNSNQSSKGNALERLKTLEELKKHHMISDDEYRIKRQQIMNEM